MQARFRQTGNFARQTRVNHGVESDSGGTSKSSSPLAMITSPLLVTVNQRAASAAGS